MIDDHAWREARRPVRSATDEEIARALRRFRRARKLKGHGLLWGGMDRVRDVEIREILPVNLGAMTYR